MAEVMNREAPYEAVKEIGKEIEIEQGRNPVPASNFNPTVSPVLRVPVQKKDPLIEVLTVTPSEAREIYLVSRMVVSMLLGADADWQSYVMVTAGIPKEIVDRDMKALEEANRKGQR